MEWLNNLLTWANNFSHSTTGQLIGILLIVAVFGALWWAKMYYEEHPELLRK